MDKLTIKNILDRVHAPITLTIWMYSHDQDEMVKSATFYEVDNDQYNNLLNKYNDINISTLGFSDNELIVYLDNNEEATTCV